MIGVKDKRMLPPIEEEISTLKGPEDNEPQTVEYFSNQKVCFAKKKIKPTYMCI